MRVSEGPLIAIFTPAYNAESTLAECIESILAQSYENFQYTIVNNCSTDRTLEIAEIYSRRDPRVSVCTNAQFVEVVENHNIAFRMTSPSAKYCKIVSADDLIFPEYLDQVVEVAEAHPSAGLIGCYQLSGDRILWQGLPYPKNLVDGREFGRQIFLSTDPEFGCGSPTSLLYRADLVRKTNAFYPTASRHADSSASYACLRDSDFAFVYQVLSLEGVSGTRETSRAEALREDLPAMCSDLLEYGNAFLSPEEYSGRLGASAGRLPRCSCGRAIFGQAGMVLRLSP